MLTRTHVLFAPASINDGSGYSRARLMLAPECQSMMIDANQYNRSGAVIVTGMILRN